MILKLSSSILFSTISRDLGTFQSRMIGLIESSSAQNIDFILATDNQ
jgi:hypothetical protein